MQIEATAIDWSALLPLRELYRQSMDCQIIHDSWAGRGLSDPYLITSEGRPVGYGAVANRYDKGAVCEFFLIPAMVNEAQPAFRELVRTSGANSIVAQSNDRLMTMLLYDFARSIEAGAVLFEDRFISDLTSPGGQLRKLTDEDRSTVFEHRSEPTGDWGIELDGRLIATGGALYHYNPPYGDIYMEVDEPYRRRGFGSYLVQELKRISYEGGHIPAARCSPSNAASRLTLQRAGFVPCGRMLTGELDPSL